MGQLRCLWRGAQPLRNRVSPLLAVPNGVWDRGWAGSDHRNAREFAAEVGNVAGAILRVMQHRIDVVEDVPLGDRLVAVVILEPHQRRERDGAPMERQREREKLDHRGSPSDSRSMQSANCDGSRVSRGKHPSTGDVPALNAATNQRMTDRREGKRAHLPQPTLSVLHARLTCSAEAVAGLSRRPSKVELQTEGSHPAWWDMCRNVRALRRRSGRVRDACGPRKPTR